jgi:hypothetical protein
MNKIKLTVAALALAMAGSANAAIVNGTDPALVASGNGANGELFVNVWDAANQISYTRDLGITFDDMLAQAANATFSLSFAADALYTATFGAVNPNTLVWNLGAVQGFNAAFDNLANYGIMTTGPDAGVFYTEPGVSGAIDVARGYINNVNGVAGGTTADNFSSTSTGGGNYYGNAGVWSNNWGGQMPFSNQTAVGNSLSFYSLNFNETFDANVMTTFVGDWKLAGDGLLTYNAQTSVVPVPAAAWLFGSGLIGMIGVARRRA